MTSFYARRAYAGMTAAVLAAAGVTAAAPAANAAPAPIQQGYVQCGTHATPNIAYGSRGTAVTFLQCELNNIGWGIHLKADGVFGGLTYNTVIDFQRRTNIKVDGIVGPATWNRLLCECGG